MKPATAILQIFSFLALLSVLRRANADVSISKPLTGQSYSASSGSASVEIDWVESSSDPPLSKMLWYTFTLCTGPNSKIEPVETLAKQVSADDLSDNQYTASISSSAGKSGYYYIQIYAKSDEGFTIHYTNRFELTGMTGSYEPSVGANSAPPDDQIQITDATQTTVASIDSASFTVSYTFQTGKTRYAPMQMQPGSKVTRNRKSWSRQHATSAVTYFSTIKNSLEQVSTLTPGWSYTMSSAVNYATPAPFPSANGGWYAASGRLTRTPTIGTKKSSATSS